MVKFYDYSEDSIFLKKDVKVLRFKYSFIKTNFCNISLTVHSFLEKSLIENLLKAETCSSPAEKSKLFHQQRVVLYWITTLFNLIRDL
jgi:hypothetical protein